MDALALMIALMINGNGLCAARPVELRQLQGETFQLQIWRCEGRIDGRAAEWRAWARQCPRHARPGEATWWSRPFLLEETVTGAGFYLNRFAEIHAGHQVALDETYEPDCAS